MYKFKKQTIESFLYIDIYILCRSQEAIYSGQIQQKKNCFLKYRENLFENSTPSCAHKNDIIQIILSREKKEVYK